jgi:hypothetical protein
VSGPSSRRAWSLWDGPKCLHTGSVVADSDADGLRTVLLGAEATGRVPLDPRRHYRVRCGSAVASAAGDEFIRTSESSSVPDDAPAHEAKAERERVEAEAKRQLERELVERLAALPPLDPAWIDREKYEAKRDAVFGTLEGIAYDPATGRSRPLDDDELARGYADRMARSMYPGCPAALDRLHEWGEPRAWDFSSPVGSGATVAKCTVRCRLCSAWESCSVPIHLGPLSGAKDPAAAADEAITDIVGSFSRMGRGARFDAGAARELKRHLAIVLAHQSGNGNGNAGGPGGALRVGPGGVGGGPVSGRTVGDPVVGGP